MTNKNNYTEQISKAESIQEHHQANTNKIDAKKIVTGKAKYTSDFAHRFPDLLHAKVVRSDIPHGTVETINASEAESMENVHTVLTPYSEHVPDTLFSSSGQPYPEPSPWDMQVLREHVRFVGDPVAAVAAESKEAADRAARLVDIEYTEHDTVFSCDTATADNAPQLFGNNEVDNLAPGSNYKRNIMSSIQGESGNIDHIYNSEDINTHTTSVETPHQSHCVPEPHASIVYSDEDDRITVITSTQVPHHTRRQLAHIFDMPIRDVRVRKPQLGSGFGSKQEMITEPIALALHLATDQPVKIELSRKEEFYATRARHPASVTITSGMTDDGNLVGLDMQATTNTGAYGSHGMTVAANIGTKAPALYSTIDSYRFEADIVHTNLPVAGAMRGYGAPQSHFAVETHLDEVARQYDCDPLRFKQDHLISEGDVDRFSSVLKDNSEYERLIQSCGIKSCIKKGKEAIGWETDSRPEKEYLHRGTGVALCTQASGVIGDEVGSAQIMMNEDGSFLLYPSGVEIGAGAHTIFTQIAAAVLGCDVEAIHIAETDTDVTPFDYGVYASSTTYISGQAIQQAALDARDQILKQAANILDEPQSNLTISGGSIISTETEIELSLQELGRKTIYGDRYRDQILGQSSYSTKKSPPPFGAQFIDVTVNGKTGDYNVNNMVYAVDCGTVLNQALAEGQLEGGMHMSFEYATGSGLSFKDGTPEVQGFRQYDFPTATDHPPMKTIFVETREDSGPLGAKSVGEIPVNGVPPALSNAIRDAIGVRINTLPITAEKIHTALQNQN